jgi:hypothetical protein
LANYRLYMPWFLISASIRREIANESSFIDGFSPRQVGTRKIDVDLMTEGVTGHYCAARVSSHAMGPHVQPVGLLLSHFFLLDPYQNLLTVLFDLALFQVP